MKKILIITFAILLSNLAVFGQSFEGKITYFNTYKSQNPAMPDQEWLSMMGSKQDYYIKDGIYKSISNGMTMQWQIYSNTDNRLYSKTANSEIAFWNDALNNSDSVLSVKLTKKVLTVLGYQCDELILKCESGVQKYYFNSKLKVDVSLFAKHKLGNWSVFLKHSKSLPLKMVIETDFFIMESTATEIKEMKLSDTEFELPKGIKTQKFPSMTN